MPTWSHTQTTAQYQPYLDHDVIPEDDDACSGFVVDEDFAYNPDDGQKEDVPSLVIDAHPSTPSIYPGGTMFMASSSLTSMQTSDEKICIILSHQG